MAQHTLLDIAKLNGNDQVVGLIEEVRTVAPEVDVFAARQISGTSYYTVKRTALATVGFTAANEGIASTKSTFVKQLHEAFVLRGAIEIDLATAAAYERGISELEMLEAASVLRASKIWLGKQIWYGTSNDAKGFGGIKALLPTTSSIVVDATGADAGAASSVYAVKMGVQDAHMVWGNNTTFNMAPFRDQQLTDGSGGKYAGRVSELTSWVGLAVGNTNCLGRIYNLGTTTGKQMTDSLASQLLEKFPVGYAPDHWFMSRRSAYQLQRSRTVTLFGGPGNAKPAGSVEIVAPLPESIYGIPIVITDSILNTDTVGT